MTRRLSDPDKAMLADARQRDRDRVHDATRYQAERDEPLIADARRRERELLRHAQRDQADQGRATSVVIGAVHSSDRAHCR